MVLLSNARLHSWLNYISALGKLAISMASGSRSGSGGKQKTEMDEEKKERPRAALTMYCTKTPSVDSCSNNP